jgi:hypothetical protein
VLFANTGLEHEETYNFINKCDKLLNFNTVWIEYVIDKSSEDDSFKIVDYKSASRKGEPFEAMVNKYGVPNKTAPFCGNFLKLKVIRNYASKIGLKQNTYLLAVGIRVDDFERMSIKSKEQNILYPLVSMFPTNKYDINRFWLNMPFDLKLKSYETNCKTCWRKSLRILMTIARERPEWYKEFILYERKYRKKFKESFSFEEILILSWNNFKPVRNENMDLEYIGSPEINFSPNNCGKVF